MLNYMENQEVRITQICDNVMKINYTSPTNHTFYSSYISLVITTECNSIRCESQAKFLIYSAPTKKKKKKKKEELQ